jgi:organic radical activating enzyme
MELKLSTEARENYNKQRNKKLHNYLCQAPTASMYFGHGGMINACCWNRKHVIGTYPQQTLQEIWHSAEAEALRRAIDKGDFSLGCNLCHDAITAQNYGAVQSLFYDALTPQPNWPVRLDFETSNKCNLECVMCSGVFSSAIRRNREKLPPLPEIYDEAFMEQLDAFLPNIQKANFLGGEPFMIDMYLEIWERLMEVNPKAAIFVQTNGTILTDRVRRILKRLPMSIGVSLDSAVPATFESIRIGAKFDKVRAHILEMKELIRPNGGKFTLSMCVMKQTWQEIPEFLAFAAEQQAEVYYNTVNTPYLYSLRTLDAAELEKGLAILTDKLGKMETRGPIEIANLRTTYDFLKTLRGWKSEADNNPRLMLMFPIWAMELYDYPNGTDEDMAICQANIDTLATMLGAGYQYEEMRQIITTFRSDQYRQEFWKYIRWLKPEEIIELFQSNIPEYHAKTMQLVKERSGAVTA